MASTKDRTSIRELENVQAHPGLIGNGTIYIISNERMAELVSSGNPVPQGYQAKLDYYIKHATTVQHYTKQRSCQGGKCNS